MASYQITAPIPPGESPMPTYPPTVAGAETEINLPSIGHAGAPDRADSAWLGIDPLSALPVAIGVLGVTTLVGLGVTLSVRRRAHDEILDEDDLAPELSAPGSVLDTHTGGLPVISPISPAPMGATPRVITLPWLPTGPIAGPSFRDLEEE